MSETPAFSIDPARWAAFELLRLVVDNLEDPVFAKDKQHRIVVANRAMCDLVGYAHDDLIGKSDPELFPAEQAAHFMADDDRVMASRQAYRIEEPISHTSGAVHTIWTRKLPLYDVDGSVIGVCGLITDITTLKRRQEEIKQLEADLAQKVEIIAGQNTLLEQLAVPVIQVWQGILLLPLVGALDSRRAGQVMESMLEAIGSHSAEIVILDITGVPVVDTSVAGYLIRSVQAAQLLGCRSILVGISAEIAQTLVGLGVDFSQITTRSTLQSGLEYGLRQLNYDVRRRA